MNVIWWTLLQIGNSTYSSQSFTYLEGIYAASPFFSEDFI